MQCAPLPPLLSNARHLICVSYKLQTGFNYFELGSNFILACLVCFIYKYKLYRECLASKACNILSYQSFQCLHSQFILAADEEHPDTIHH